MIAVDSNILVYAHRGESPWSERARAALDSLAARPTAWALPWSCLHEFYAVVTHPKIFATPTPPATAIAAMEAWLAVPNLVLLSEGQDHMARLSALLTRGRVSGPLAYDARIAAVCLSQGVTELWTHDRDYGRFPDLATRDPLV